MVQKFVLPCTYVHIYIIKPGIMRSQNFNREILLFTGTSFAKREFINHDADKNQQKSYSQLDKLEMACWNGLLDEMLPELADSDLSKKESFIWKIIASENFLHICRGTHDIPFENELTIDPYFFTSSVNIN